MDPTPEIEVEVRMGGDWHQGHLDPDSWRTLPDRNRSAMVRYAVNPPSGPTESRVAEFNQNDIRQV
jgi:hypothetical protein